jgi:hypothetical protein
MTWLAYQRVLRDVLLAKDPAPSDFLALGDGEAPRWQAYRRMVRSRFYTTIDHAFERFIGIIGVDRFHRRVDRFLAEDPPRSPYLRDLPGEFLKFVERRPDALADSEELPPYTLDLLRYEWAELDVAYSYEEVRSDDVVDLDMEKIAVLSPSHRMLDLEYPVHRMGTDGTGGPTERAPLTLCLYRDRATHEVETLELTPVAASMLSGMRDRTGPLSGVVRDAAAAHGVTIDLAFIEALSTLLADLTERGVILGSFDQTENPP